MKKEKIIKLAIVFSLLFIEIFVWTAYHSVNLWQMATAFSSKEATSIGIIGGADGPTAIYLASDKNGVSKDYEKGMLILVNKENSFDSSYKPDDLAPINYYVSDRAPETRFMREEAALAFNKMVEAAKLENIELLMTTAYRSYDFQKMLYDNYVKTQGAQEADRFSAKPGQSEHQTGLAVDVSAASVGFELSDDFGETAEGKWLSENAHNFGFIIRYPKGSEEITGYNYEPWHVRYVGIEAANQIYGQNLTLEEYLQNSNIN